MMKEYILFEISRAAEWRSQKAIEYPEDQRNRRCARSLELLKANVAAVPADHWFFKMIWRAYYGHRLEPPDAAILMGELGSLERLLFSRYGFDVPQSGNAEEFLKEFARRCSTVATAREKGRLYFFRRHTSDPIKFRPSLNA